MCIECMANPNTKAPEGQHASEILTPRITREKADNKLEDVLTRLELNEKGLRQ